MYIDEQDYEYDFFEEILKKEKIDFLTEKLSKNSPTSLSGEMNYSFFISYLQTIDILYKDWYNYIVSNYKHKYVN